uniref:NADH-ubiquinone oxidoreductase chain 4L n=1 Tax=Dendropoma gregarium TaxID=169306 RepID=E2FLR4_9CAEN|nr:NADH dehydrogenase subunit 4L [Dendropoma gregarium]ADI79380.1 NADH dehydrogenase subunit 4L [Dendropoma gregarium]
MSWSYLTLYAVLGVCFSMLALSLQYKHLLNVLLCLEGAMMCLFLMLYSLDYMSLGTFSALIFITLSVCEASLGLAVLVSLIRSYGNDYVHSFSSQKC